LVSGLPSEALDWIAAADGFEAGQLTADQLMAVREAAWKFHDDQRGTVSQAALSGLGVAMQRLWPEHDPERWHESAWFFLRGCEEAGVSEGQWWLLLQGAFPDVLDGRNG
jgi:hypothetical protein